MHEFEAEGFDDRNPGAKILRIAKNFLAMRRIFMDVNWATGWGKYSGTFSSFDPSSGYIQTHYLMLGIPLQVTTL